MAAVSMASSTYRVLIVDDNEGIHQDFRTLLQPRRGPDELDELAAEIFGERAAPEEPAVELPSYRCDSAFQGDSALENVKDAVANGEQYALAFIDIRMPPSDVAGLQEGREIIWAPSILRYVFAIMRLLLRRVWRIVAAR